MSRTSFEGVCQKTCRYLDSYLDSELSVETNHQVLKHLDRCPACAAELDMRTRLKSRVKTAGRALDAPPELAVRVWQGLRQRPSRPWFAIPAVRRWALAAIAVLMVAGGAWVARSGEAPPAIDDRPAQNAYIRKISSVLNAAFKPGLADHLHCAVFRKYPANPPSVETMVADLGPYRDLLPAINAAVPNSFQVVMAHRCTIAGRKFVHLVLRDLAQREGNRVISLILARRQAGESFAGMRVAARVNGVALYQSAAGHYQVAGFESGEYLGSVVSDRGRAGNLEVAKILTPATSVLAGRNL